MYLQLTFIVIAFLLSGVLLLTVDSKIYAVNHMRREKKYARILGGVNICFLVLLTIAIIISF